MGALEADLENRIDGERHIVFLATSVDGHPHVVPVWYFYDDGHVQITTDGRAAREVERNDRVSLALQADTDGYPDWMATLIGRADLLTDETEVAELTTRIYEKYMGPDRDEWRGDVYRETAENPEPDRVIIDVEVKSAMYREF